MGLLTKRDEAHLEASAQKRRQLNAETIRESIQTQALVKVLQDHALGKGRTKMTPAKLKAIEMLLDKSLPDLSSMKLDVEAKSVTFNVTTTFKPRQA